MSSRQGLSPGDPNSYSRPEECVVTDISLDVQINFERKVVHGTVTYTCKRIAAGVDYLILDTDSLTISKVYCKQTSQELQFTVGEPVGTFGSKLQITLLSSFAADQEFEICIDYENSPTAGGLQWMEAGLTAGKRQPYLYSQFQSIFARTMLPCQDTPSVKHTYSAKVTVDKELTVLMSAVPEPKESAAFDKVTYVFRQKIPIPCYLIAIAVGDITSKKVGPRTTVWTEKEMIDAAAWEFEKTEEMLQTAENLCGPYIWGIYDILVLPPTFPYGGMENPCLTFATPTLVVGDRSLTNVIAHEIAHSWTGNLVTNVNWEHFWLNEGHTVFVERKIIGSMYGEEERQFAMVSGWTDLSNAITSMGKDNPLTKLVPDLTEASPEDAFSKVPYEKGSALLYTIETKLGGPDVIEPWLKAYIANFKGKSINTDQWKAFLYSYFSTEAQQAALNTIEWDNWLFATGMPTTKPTYDLTLFKACETLCNRWLEGTDLPTTNTEYDALSVSQKIEFLAQLLINDNTMPVPRILKLGSLYKLIGNNNAEIVSRWYQLCLRGRTEDQLVETLQFVTDVGRLQYLRPLYQDMYAYEAVRQRAIDTFLVNRPNMHPITAETIAKDLHLTD